MTRIHKVTLAILSLAILGICLLVAPAPTATAAGACYPGSYISNRDGHNYVAFNTGKANAGYANWVLTKKPWQVQVAERITGKTSAPWGPANSIGEVYVGFPWVDRLPWNYFFTPWDGFTLCKR